MQRHCVTSGTTNSSNDMLLLLLELLDLVEVHIYSEEKL